MANKREIRDWKPNMAALPPGVGEKIMKQIAETPPMDMDTINREADKVDARLKEAWGPYEGND